MKGENEGCETRFLSVLTIWQVLINIESMYVILFSSHHLFMKGIYLLLFVFTACNGYAQGTAFRMGNGLSDSIDQVIYSINNIKNDTIKNKRLAFDSIDVRYKKSESKIETENFFRKSKSKLLIDYFFNNNIFLLVQVREVSPKFNDLFSTKLYYYSNDTLAYTRFFRTIRICMGRPFEKSEYELYGYNPAFDTAFIKNYTAALLTKIKKRP